MPYTTSTPTDTLSPSASQVRSKALYIVSTILGDGLDDDITPDSTSLLSYTSYYAAFPSSYHVCSVTIEEAATSLYANATTKLGFTRSFALITRQVIQELQLWDVGLAVEFRNEIIDLAASTFVICWMKKFCGKVDDLSSDDDEGTPPLDSLVRLPQITAFFGDLYALGLVPPGTMQASLLYLCSNLLDVDDILGLQLLLDRINHTYHSRRAKKTATPLDPSVLRQCYRLVAKYTSRMSYNRERETQSILGILDEMIDSILSCKAKEPLRTRFTFNSFQSISLECHASSSSSLTLLNGVV
ncbi:hypothetical protein BDN72DRAFT_962777 [Pluteus cervinus]|uniref:Uncharacterized protein n=1 Tax=Pluteus cervinus TaxID=181527 RepID=A0ACD3AHP4_9AGAR|nr:hypothetical protein BDN72DRAFT_962777 [Pluteus cervinus]